MDPLLKLGPFETTIKNSDIEVGEIDKLNLSKSITDILDIDLVPDTYIDSNGRDDERAYIREGYVDIEWGIEILSNKHGIWSMTPTIYKAKGAVKIEALPLGSDPSDTDIEWEIHTIDFTTESGGWSLTGEIHEYFSTWSGKIDGIFAVSVELNFESKTIKVGF